MRVKIQFFSEYKDKETIVNQKLKPLIFYDSSFFTQRFILL